MIIDNTATGRTLAENGLRIVDTIMTSSTCLFASKAALGDAAKKKKIFELKMLFEAVLNARDRVMLEMNVDKGRFQTLVTGLPSMRSPTVSPLYGDDGYAIKIAVKKSEVPALLPRLKALGATDILEYELRKVLS
jgi:ATP phosphoribosyltransferase